METQVGVRINEGPSDWQIYQRTAQGTADIQLAGTWHVFDWLPPETVCTVQARVVSEDTGAVPNEELDWQDATVDGNQFSVTLKGVPAGGLYRIETRIQRKYSQDVRGLRGDCVHHVGVGDIYVIAGQSNASGTGKGAVTDPLSLGVHLFGNDESWKLATHPLEDSKNTLHPVTMTGIAHGHSPWLTFGRRVYTATGIPIGLVPTALGGSPISRWIDEDGRQGDLLSNLRDMVDKVGGEVAGVLWYQGESDASPDAVGLYRRRFEQFVGVVRDYVHDAQLPVFTAQLNRFLDRSADDECWSEMREIQRRAALTMDNVFLIPTIDVPMSDAIHNSASGNVMIGERFANAALRHVYGMPTMSEFPNIETIACVDDERTQVELSFRNVSGEWMGLSAEMADFRVEDDRGEAHIEDVSAGPNGALVLHLSRSVSRDAIVSGLFGANPSLSARDDLGRCITPFRVSVAGIP